MPYSPVTVIGYNANPPADDGTQVVTNEVEWAKHIEKIGNPLKTALESVDSNVEDIVLDIEADIATLFANLYAPSGTKMLFGSTAPSGWTTDNTYTNHGLRLVGTAGTPGNTFGSTAYSSVLTSRTIATANLPNDSLGFSLSAASHTHSFYDAFTTSTHSGHSHGAYTNSSNPSHNHNVPKGQGNQTFDSSGGASGVNRNSGNSNSTSISHSHSAGTYTAGSHSHTGSVSGTTGSSGSLSVTGSISLGGSGTAMDFSVQTYDVIMATKD